MSTDDTESNEVTAKTYGVLNVTSAQDDCWLIKIPPALTKHWEEQSEGTILGELTFTRGGKTNKPKYSVQLAAESSQSVPTHYTLQAMTKRIPTMHPFVRKPNGSVDVLGVVSRTATMQVDKSQQAYRQLLKKRLIETSVSSQRYVKPVGDTLTRDTTKQGAFGAAVHQYGKRLLEQQNQGLDDPSRKKAKFDPEQPTRSVVFQLFSQQKYWTVKDLKLASARPEIEIREVLREIGEYHRSGDHKNSWELKVTK